MPANLPSDACSNVNLISKVTFLAMLNSADKAFFLKMTDDQWQIVSFDPRTRITCIRITKNGSRLISKVLPVLCVPASDEII